jgi:hypothetical protein
MRETGDGPGLNPGRLDDVQSQALLAIYLVSIVASLTAVELVAGIPVALTAEAIFGTMLVAILLPIFLFARFSFGYLAGVLFYGMIAGFIWLSYFSPSRYDHAAARWSAIGSLLAFLIPVLFQTAPANRISVMTPRSMELLLKIGLGIAGLTLALNAGYGFAFVGIEQAQTLRSSFSRPILLNYFTNIEIYAVLPFAFAFFALRKQTMLAALALIIIVAFYPVLLNKTVLLAVGWLPFIFWMFRTFEGKRAAVLALLVPLLFGLFLFSLTHWDDGFVGRNAKLVFGYINERMFAVPSIAMDYYSDFFAANPRTLFCQINIVRSIMSCPYLDQLGVVFSDRYHVGNLNASLFATEGIASVGPNWAPAIAFFCGLVLSLGNTVSTHLPASMIATSAALSVLALANVPLSTTLLTNGLLVLFLLWYVCPNLSQMPDRFPKGQPGFRV